MGFDVFLVPNSKVVVFYVGFDDVLAKLSVVFYVGFDIFLVPNFSGSCVLHGF